MRKCWKIVQSCYNGPRNLKLTCVIFLACFLLLFYIFNPRQTVMDIRSFHSRMADTLDDVMKKQPPASDEKWVSATNLNGHIYSAYFDARPEVILDNLRSTGALTWADVRIIAILPFDTSQRSVECVLRFPGDKEGEFFDRQSSTSLKAIEENWSLEFSAFFVLCELVFEEESKFNLKNLLPRSVGIHLVGSDDPVNFVDVHYPKNGIKQFYEYPEKFMALCVPVFHHNFDYPHELVEFIEFYRMMGVNRFTFYNASISSDVSRVLQFYQEHGVASVLAWQLPSSIYVYERTLRQEGLFAALNDCLYRNSLYNNYNYVAVFDFDEFLVPRNYSDFFDLMEFLDPPSVNQENSFTAFLIRNVYFYTMYSDNEHQNNEVYLYMGAKTKRLQKPHPARERSRYIVRGRETVELGNYQTWQLLKNHYEKVVEPDVALSHHYAPCEAEETGCYLKPISIDTIALKFSKPLMKHVLGICDFIFGGTCPPPKPRTPG